MQKKPDDKFLISLADIVFLFRQGKKTILVCTVLLALAGLFWGLTKHINYKAEGTFREKGVKGNHVGGLAQAIFSESFSGSSSENEAINLIKSRKLMQEVVKRMNLQATLIPETSGETLFNRMIKNIRIEWALFKNSFHPVLKDLPCPLCVENIQYSNEVPLFLNIHFMDQKNYEITDTTNGANLGKGQTGAPFIAEAFSLTLKEKDPSELLNTTFSLILWPNKDIAERLSKELEVDTLKNDKGVLKFVYHNPDRHFASLFINTSMQVYQDYLKSYHDKLCTIQMDYLYRRQNETNDNLKNLLQEHAEFLASDVSNSGFTDSKEEIDFLVHRQHSLKDKLLSKELEIKRLKTVEPNQAYFDHYSDEPSDHIINGILKDIRKLKQDRDTLDIALRKSTFLNDAELDKASYEYQGINLDMSEKIYLECCKKSSEEESSIRRTLFFLNELKDPDFEITSLSSVLNDSVSNILINKASDIELNLKDENNQSTREQARLKADLDLQRTFLKLHLEQMIQLMKLNKQHIDEKIFALQNITLKLTDQQIALLEKYLYDYLQERINNLEQEKLIVNEHLQEINNDMAKLPKKWMYEQLIDQRVEVNQTIVEEVARIVETKNIGHNLDIIQSAPIDTAVAPLQPNSPKLLLKTMLGAALGGILGSILALGRALTSGVQASAANLRLLDQHVSGSLSRSYDPTSKKPLKDEDLNTLRRLQSYLERPPNDQENKERQSPSVLLIEGQGPDYSHDLAHLIHKKSRRVLVIDLDFNQPLAAPSKGLLQYLQGEIPTLPIQKAEYGAYLPAGGVHRFTSELLSSPLFAETLGTLSKEYDWIIAVSRAFVKSAEAEMLSTLFPMIAITIEKEKIEELAFYNDLSTQGLKKISYVLADTNQ